MRAKYPVVAILLIGCFTCLIASNSYAADRLYYGSWGGKQHIPTLKDSLKFNILMEWAGNSSDLQDYVVNGMRLIAVDTDTSCPHVWASKSHYTLWEAEGFPGSNLNLRYDGGTPVNDDSASGGKAMRFSGPGTPRLIQTGPTYYQERICDTIINYTVEFRLKFLDTPRLPSAASVADPAVAVCSLMVVDRGNILVAKTIYKDDFVGTGYNIFKFVDYTVPEGSRMEFQVYWFGTSGILYIDYVKVYDKYGWQLIDDPSHSVANMIKVCTSQDWTKTINTEGDTVIFRWYGKDEPFSVDYYMPHRYIDSLLREVSQERVLFQAFCPWNSEPNKLHEYLLKRDPAELCVDPYPMQSFGHDTTGDLYQQKWSEHAEFLNDAKNEAESFNKDLWLFEQAFTYALRDTGNCTYPLIGYDGYSWCPTFRDPSRYELRSQAFLGLCYGADGILYFVYPWNHNGGLLTGLYDLLNDSTTYKWREIRDFIGPRMKVLGPTYGPLEWQGACLDDVVKSFILRNGQPSYLDSIRSHNPTDDPHWVQVGFFENATADTSYFMLVNRECLETEGANYDVFVTKTGGPYQIRDMYTDSVVDYVNGTSDHITIYLGPGEGKLLRLEEIYPGEQVKKVPADYPTIQAAINAAMNGDTVLVAPGTYYENINFIGKAIVVASHFIFNHDSATVESTIINGSNPWNPDSASVVTFVSGESSNSILEGFTITGGTGTSYNGPGRALRMGGGIYCSQSSPTIINNSIIENNIPPGGGRWEMGGGIACYLSGTSPTIVNNLILNNYSGVDGGGGIFSWGGSPKIVNNTFSSNTYDGIEMWGSVAFIVTNNIIVNNDRYGLWFVQYPYPPYLFSISHNDVWNNSYQNFKNCPPEFGDTTWGTNINGIPCDSFRNIIRDPMFVAPDTDYHLQESSPCVNAGDNNVSGLPDFDFDGNPRIRGWYVDMGAYESEYVTFICGDVNGDGSVPNLGDVVYLISYVYKAGPPPPPPISRADVNSSGGLPNLGDVVYLIAYVYKGGPVPFCPGIYGQ